MSNRSKQASLSMESRLIQEQDTHHQRINSGGSNSHPQKATPCLNHFQDSTAARTALATILEIIAVYGNDLNLEYSSSDRQKCPMLKCFHISATPMQQIYHVANCVEASKGEIQCWTCHKCHEFKKWQTMCNTLKSPVELLMRRLSNRKRGSNTSAGEHLATKRGKLAGNDDFTVPSRQQGHGIETMWPLEMEDPTSLPPQKVASQNAALELDAGITNIPLAVQPRLDLQPARLLPTPPSTRNHSWSENPESLVAYEDAKVTNTPEQPQPPPYIVSPQTTVDDYPTDSLRLGIPPVQYIDPQSSFMESPEDMEADQALWADHAIFSEAQDPSMSLQFPSTMTDATASMQHRSPSEKTASIFSNYFPASRIPKQRMQKQNTWPTQLEYSNNGIPRQSLSFEHQQRQTSDNVPRLAGQNVPAAATSQQKTRLEPLVQRQQSFDARAQDSITVTTLGPGLHTGGSGAPEEDHHHHQEHQHHQHQALPSRRGGTREQQQHAGVQQYVECLRCGQRFQGIAKNRRQHLKRHVESKHGDVRYRCVQPGCRRSYNRVDNLHDHERKCHRFNLQPGAVELAAGDVELRERGPPTAAAAAAVAAAAVGQLAGGTGHEQGSSAMDMHFAVFRYPMPAEGEGHGWEYRAGADRTEDLEVGRRTAGFLTEELDALMAGVSGGQHDEREEEEEEEAAGAGRPDVGPDEVAPRPLDLPCVSWRMLGD